VFVARPSIPPLGRGCDIGGAANTDRPDG